MLIYVLLGAALMTALLANCIAIEVFSPVREDYLPQRSGRRG